MPARIPLTNCVFGIVLGAGLSVLLGYALSTTLPVPPGHTREVVITITEMRVTEDRYWVFLRGESAPDQYRIGNASMTLIEHLHQGAEYTLVLMRGKRGVLEAPFPYGAGKHPEGVHYVYAIRQNGVDLRSMAEYNALTARKRVPIALGLVFMAGATLMLGVHAAQRLAGPAEDGPRV